MSRLCPLGQPPEERIVEWLLHQPGEDTATAAAPARREAVFWLLLQPGENKRVESPSSLLAHALSTMDSVNGANSVNSKTIGLTNRISNKLVLTLKLALNQEVS